MFWPLVSTKRYELERDKWREYREKSIVRIMEKKIKSITWGGGA